MSRVRLAITYRTRRELLLPPGHSPTGWSRTVAQCNEPNVWVPIPGHEGSYEVSHLGRVRSIDRVIIDRNGKRYRRRGQTLRTWPERGYLCVRLGIGRQYAVHRLVLLAFVGPCPEGQEALHQNGDPSDPRLTNLRWGTHSENQLDQVRHGTNHAAQKRVCIRNHPLFPPNLVPSHLRIGERACWACFKAHSKARWCRDNGFAAPDIQDESDHQYTRILTGRTDGRAGRKIVKWRNSA